MFALEIIQPLLLSEVLCNFHQVCRCYFQQQDLDARSYPFHTRIPGNLSNVLFMGSGHEGIALNVQSVEMDVSGAET